MSGALLHLWCYRASISTGPLGEGVSGGWRGRGISVVPAIPRQRAIFTLQTSQNTRQLSRRHPLRPFPNTEILRLQPAGLQSNHVVCASKEALFEVFKAPSNLRSLKGGSCAICLQIGCGHQQACVFHARIKKLFLDHLPWDGLGLRF